MALDVEKIEIALLLEGVFQRYGYDFRGYARPSVARRIEKACQLEKVASVSALQERLLHEPQAMARFAKTMSINVTSMFRDPEFFKAFRDYAIPTLGTYPYLRIWVAGCATGEEAYSVAILLHEAGLLDRSRIYATDFSDENVQQAQKGIFDLSKMQEYTRNYQLSGGQQEFSTYYSTQHQKVIFRKDLSENISFAQHNLATDASFNEFHAIFCRNVMIYFDTPLQERAMHLLHDSLGSLGFLSLGTHESIWPIKLREEFTEQKDGTRLFRAIN